MKTGVWTADRPAKSHRPQGKSSVPQEQIKCGSKSFLRQTCIHASENHFWSTLMYLRRNNWYVRRSNGTIDIDFYRQRSILLRRAATNRTFRQAWRSTRPLVGAVGIIAAYASALHLMFAP